MLNFTTTTAALAILVATSGSAIAGTATQFDGYSVSPVGDATLDTSNGRLKVSNLGSSGKDGVSINLGGNDLQEVKFDLAADYSGVVIAEGTGTVDGQPGQTTVEAFVGDMDGDGISEIMVGRFIPGAHNYEAHVFSDGQHVATFSGRLGDVTGISALPSTIGVGPSYRAADGPVECDYPLVDMYYCYGTPGHPCGIDWYSLSGSMIVCCDNLGAGIVHQCGIPCGLAFEFEEQVALDFAPSQGNPGGSVIGDSLVFVPEIDPARIGNLQRAELRGMDSGDITVRALHSDGQAFLCDGDANGSGTVDFDDLNLVLSNWGTAGPAGDVNNSGFVDFDDLNLVLSNWGRLCLEL